VCSLCAPAGDTLPGDGTLPCYSAALLTVLTPKNCVDSSALRLPTGLNQSYQLSDYRVSLPECGLFSPQRVCLLCYFDT
jgi:hypothetical protein